MKKNSPSKGIIIILSAPSGGGKSSLCKALLEADSNLMLSISATSRPIRPREVDGVHYFFKTRQHMEELISTGQLLEHAEIYHNLYGTPKQYVEEQLAKGFDVLFDIDYQGAREIQKQIPDRTVSIFIMPPSLDELKKRLLARRQDSAEVIEERLKCAQHEMDQAKYYDHVVINDDFKLALAKIQELIKQARIGKV